jgi:phage terminase Nu1 subunit (DNA packaging protein)
VPSKAKAGVPLSRIAYVLDMLPMEIEKDVTKLGMPRIAKDQFDLAKTVRWKVNALRKQNASLKERKNERTLEEIAELFGKEPRWINRLTKEKGFPRLKRGVYDLVECVQWQVDDLERRMEEIRTGGEKMQDVELRIAKAKAQLLEIKAAKENAEAITINTVLQELEPVLAAMRSKLLGIPKHAARELASKEIEEYLDTFIRRTLDELATIPDQLYRAARIQDVSVEGDVLGIETPAEDDDQRVGGSVSRPQRGSKRRKRSVANKQS